MPGTIRVSVLEFIDLPELLSSPISIKVSMGKTHYETSDKGDFSFPLTTLRDDVILIIQDAGGNEISRAGVQVKSIVEKGYWDDLFPLEGGGRVHLQFQFALSEDDRSRIRMMRETVLRRKHVERHDSNLKNSGSNLASSFNLNRELSDSQKCLIQIGDLSAKEAAHQSPSASNQNIPDEIPVTEKTNKIRLDRIQPLSVENDADRSKDNPSAIPLMQEVEVNKPKVNNTVLVDRMRMQSTPAIRPSPTSSEENLVHYRSSELSNSPSKGEEKTDASEAAPSRRRTPGNVKNVISAFESSLTQSTKPRIKPTRNAQPNVVEKQPSSEVNQSKDNSKPTWSQATTGPPLAGELTHDLANTKQKEQKRKFFEASDGTKSLKLKGKKNQVGEENLSGKECDDIDAKNDESYQKSVPEKPDYDRNSVTGESVSRVEDEQIPSKRSGGWIFRDERRRLCVTTGGDHMLDLVGGGRTSYTFIRKGEMKISTEENRGTSEPKANGGNHEHQKMIKPKNSDDVKHSGGPLANALKVAVMLGLGTLVLLTRQRKKKK
ncbi:uncharacterized protein LOC111493817 isoform X1 [Cucurbita maxima]|uniref:Uncharacterized protein LOC111493817 isoform X1 n=1 Tax=Cucurbita maxima TaxID=3661 RepID=A0A6J1KAX5_CUCMA|nr:uncharacterized protein LOC111493817 isoform X1 [Cucurbita maxima]